MCICWCVNYINYRTHGAKVKINKCVSGEKSSGFKSKSKFVHNVKGKVIPLQAQCGPEGE